MTVPQFPFDGYDPTNDYPAMMQLIIDIETRQATLLGAWLLATLGPKSVIDIGCGPGNYLIPFKEAGCDVYGVDACSVGGGVLAPAEFARVDLRFPFAPPHTFDLALCIEVVEHIEQEWAPLLVDTLAGCADTILLTAATPGQGGTQHVNEQPHEYWLTMFNERHGYIVHPAQSELKAFLAGLPQWSCQGWLQPNIFLLERVKK